MEEFGISVFLSRTQPSKVSRLFDTLESFSQKIAEFCTIKTYPLNLGNVFVKYTCMISPPFWLKHLKLPFNRLYNYKKELSD